MQKAVFKSMNKQVLKALNLSIEKWERIVKGDGVDRGEDDCALCNMFIKGNCRGCPVSEVIGYWGCNNTPYENWTSHQNLKHWLEDEKKVHCSECKDLATKELEFLKDLRVEYESNIK